MASDEGGPNLPPAAPPSAETLPVVTWDAGRLPALRIARLDPLYFSSAKGYRYSTPKIPAGVLYLGDSPTGCFWEVTWDALAGRGGHLQIPKAFLEARRIHRATFLRPMRLFPAHGGALKKIGANNVSCFNGPYSICTEWAAYVHAWDAKLDGILYPAARGAGLNLALFGERVTKADLQFSQPGTPLLDEPAIVQLLAEEQIYSFD
jgi:hypothetical protein